MAADALSRMENVECHALLTHHIDSDMLERLKQSWSIDVGLQKLITQLQQSPTSHKHYTWNGL